ncbi:hypothetical protein N2152v2_000885 [Parachlorella kessleri]
MLPVDLDALVDNDPQFDHLLKILFGDLDAFEEAIAPSSNTLERAKAIGKMLLKAQEERKQRPPPPPPPKAVPPQPGLHTQPTQQQHSAALASDAMVHITVTTGASQLPKVQQAANVPLSEAGQASSSHQLGHAASGSPGTLTSLKRSLSQQGVGEASASEAEDAAKRQRTSTPELLSPTGVKYRGVRLYNGRYQARVKFGGKETGLGHFDTPLEAAKAYDLEQLRRLGSKAQLNLPHLRQQYKEQLGQEGGDTVSVPGSKPSTQAAQPPSSRQHVQQLSRQRSGEAAADEVAKARAQQLAQQRPMRTAFAGVTPVAQIRLEPAGGLEWAMRYLCCPAGMSIGELRQTMAFGLSQQYGTAAFARPLGLAVANDLDSSANFDAICTTNAEGSLLLRDRVTIRELVDLLEDCTEELVLEYTC